ncbi:MAG: DUF1579 family protein [Chitinophagaceae bacterium]
MGSEKSKKTAKAETQEAALPPGAVNPEEAERRRSEMEARMLSPMHHMLMTTAGHWQLEMKVWSSPKSQEVMTSLFECDTRPMAEGRFLVSEIRGMSGNMMYEAQSVMGYNATTQKFERLWFDNLSSGMLLLEGTYDDASKKINFTGATTDPRTHERIPMRQVLHLADPAKIVLEVFLQFKEGKEFKSMEINYNRR